MSSRCEGRPSPPKTAGRAGKFSAVAGATSCSARVTHRRQFAGRGPGASPRSTPDTEPPDRGCLRAQLARPPTAAEPRPVPVFTAGTGASPGTVLTSNRAMHRPSTPGRRSNSFGDTARRQRGPCRPSFGPSPLRDRASMVRQAPWLPMSASPSPTASGDRSFASPPTG